MKAKMEKYKEIY